MSRRPRRTVGPPPVADAFRLESQGGARAGLCFVPDHDIGRLCNRVLDLLDGHGVVIRHPGAAEALRRAGAAAGRDADRLRLPRAMVRAALEATPKAARLAGKTRARDLVLPRADGGIVLRTGTGAHGYVDPRDASYRGTDLVAVAEIAAVAESLDQVGFIAHPFVHGVPEKTADIHGFAALIARTTKHVWMQPYQRANIGYLMRIAAVAAGGDDALRAHPVTSIISTAFSPLEFKAMDSEAIVQAGRFGVPIHACSLPSGGGTAPYSVAGTALMAVAEIVAMATIAHHVAPDSPVIATPLIFTLDMATGAALMASVEAVQGAALAVAVLKRGFGLLTHSYGMGSDTPDADHQSMAERALLGQAVALAGADILGGVGQLQTATAFSPVQAVLDDRLGAMLRRFVRVPATDDAALNWDAMAAIRAGGHFLDDPHTLAHCRDALGRGVFLNQGRDDYEASRRRTAFDAAREVALAAIDAAPAEGYLDDAQRAEIADLVAHADAHVDDAFAGRDDRI
ncbi:trimethylamine methyltransferase family protein [Rhodovulum marinum]|uniref:Trimethylamine:corrinoid methyltransferase-like protein n=1 Tax=Rhodovulum marinum TaxID=320662 RepID=A0A4R2Q045_9RHOB|nr:trimethylamine methyltransferase family protein [Rhodovulum marinum]TCP41014.1 trimethylamine:corrinoid methyltransferase-like protein [Rhodovulum marinum]